MVPPFAGGGGGALRNLSAFFDKPYTGDRIIYASTTNWSGKYWEDNKGVCRLLDSLDVLTCEDETPATLINAIFSMKVDEIGLEETMKEFDLLDDKWANC